MQCACVKSGCMLAFVCVTEISFLTCEQLCISEGERDRMHAHEKQHSYASLFVPTSRFVIFLSLLFFGWKLMLTDRMCTPSWHMCISMFVKRDMLARSNGCCSSLQAVARNCHEREFSFWEAKTLTKPQFSHLLPKAIAIVDTQFGTAVAAAHIGYPVL